MADHDIGAGVGASLLMLKAREQAGREDLARTKVAEVGAELEQERKGRRRGGGESPPGPMVPTY